MATAEHAAMDAIVRRDPCAYCGATEEFWKPGEVGADHIVPIVTGGELDWTNLTGSCRDCNSSKGSLSLLSFLLRWRAA